jgi:hypothetical protein
MRRRPIYLGLSLALLAILAGCGNLHAIGNMPGPVRQVLNTSTLAGTNLATAMLEATGNQAQIGKGQLPGYYTYGPAEGSQGYYVQFQIPVDSSGVEQRVGYEPQVSASATLAGQVYMEIRPLPGEAYDRLYYDPSTQLASFDFKLLPDGAVMDQSWDAVLVNS